MTTVTTSPTTPDEFEAPASDDRIERLAETLERHNIEAIVVATGAEPTGTTTPCVPATRRWTGRPRAARSER
jgi:hypothetical protein